MSDKFNPIDSLIPVIAAAVEDWKLNNSSEALKTTVKKKLDNECQAILLKLLGFDKSYNSSWVLDHCNGRSGNSAAGDFIKRVQQDAIEEWFRTVAMPTLSETEQLALQKSMQAHYEACLKQDLRARVASAAKHDLDTLVNKLVASNQIDNYLRVQELINPTPLKE